MGLLQQAWKEAIRHDIDNRHHLLTAFYPMQDEIMRRLGGLSKKAFSVLKKSIIIRDRNGFSSRLDLEVTSLNDVDYEIMKAIVKFYAECVESHTGMPDFSMKYQMPIYEIIYLSVFDYCMKDAFVCWDN